MISTSWWVLLLTNGRKCGRPEGPGPWSPFLSHPHPQLLQAIPQRHGLCAALSSPPSQDHSSAARAGMCTHRPQDVSAKSSLGKRNRSRTIQIWSVLRLQYPNDEFKQREKKKKTLLINLQEYLSGFYNMMECSSECLNSAYLGSTGKTLRIINLSAIEAGNYWGKLGC